MTVAASFIAAWLLLAEGAPQSLAPDATVATLDVRPGERLIVTTPRETIRGRLLRLADDGLVLADGPAQHTVPLHDLNRVERRMTSCVGTAPSLAPPSVASSPAPSAWPQARSPTR